MRLTNSASRNLVISQLANYFYQGDLTPWRKHLPWLLCPALIILLEEGADVSSVPSQGQCEHGLLDLGNRAGITRGRAVGRPGGPCSLVVYFSGALHPREQLLVMTCQLAGNQADSVPFSGKWPRSVSELACTARSHRHKLICCYSVWAPVELRTGPKVCCLGFVA